LNSCIRKSSRRPAASVPVQLSHVLHGGTENRIEQIRQRRRAGR
jgi:hypothetical protein